MKMPGLGVARIAQMMMDLFGDVPVCKQRIVPIITIHFAVIVTLLIIGYVKRGKRNKLAATVAMGFAQM